MKVLLATDGMPCSKPITISIGAGALAGSEVSAYGSSGGAFQGSSRTPASRGTS